MYKKKKKIIITSGGSGGHIFPGISLAKYLLKKNIDILWIGNINNMEKTILPKYRIKIKFINLINIYKLNIKKIFIFLYQLILSIIKSIKIINNYKPNLIIGMGNYISFPICITARILHIPLIIHEQNKVIGKTNYILSKISNKNLQAFKNTIKNAITVGNPIRKEILLINDISKKIINRTGPLRILVIGGSQGSEIINKIIPEIFKKLKKKIFLWHQIGNKNSINKMKKIYKKINNKNYILTKFIYNMKKAYLWSDLIISRSGAMVISEIININLPSILIPYNHFDMQQYKNAKILEKIGGAIIIKQNLLNNKKLTKIIKKLNRKILFKMSNNIKKIIKTKNSNKLIYNEIYKIIKKKQIK